MKTMSKYINRAPYDIIFALSKNKLHLSGVKRVANVSYAHTWHLLKAMECDGVVTSERNGNKNEYVLTKKGQHVLKAYRVIDKEIARTE